MTSNVSAVPGLVERTIRVAGPDIDDSVLIRSISHRGMAANITSYPSGHASLREARARAEDSGLWYEEARALLMQAWCAAEFRDLAVARDHRDQQNQGPQEDRHLEDVGFQRRAQATEHRIKQRDAGEAEDDSTHRRAPTPPLREEEEGEEDDPDRPEVVEEVDLAEVGLVGDAEGESEHQSIAGDTEKS